MTLWFLRIFIATITAWGFATESHNKSPIEALGTPPPTTPSKYFYSCEGNNVQLSLCENPDIAKIASKSDCQNSVGGPALTKEFNKKQFQSLVVENLKIPVSNPSENNIKKVEEFIVEASFGKSNPPSQDLNVLKSQVTSLSQEASMSESSALKKIEKINKQISNIPTDVCDASFRDYLNGADGNDFFAKLVEPNGFKSKKCGINKQSITDAVLECSAFKKINSKVKLELVSREINSSGKVVEFWRAPDKNGKNYIWSPIAESKMDMNQAMKYCKSLKEFGKEWKLPTKKEYLDTLLNSEPDTNRLFFSAMEDSYDIAYPKIFWTSSKFGQTENWAIGGGKGDLNSPNDSRMGVNGIYQKINVRCVAVDS